MYDDLLEYRIYTITIQGSMNNIYFIKIFYFELNVMHNIKMFQFNV